MADPWLDDGDSTTALLQDEIARLEEELRLRDEALASIRAVPEPDDRAADGDPHARQVAELTAELAARDEMVALLLDQVQLFEETERTTRAEWDQLNRWVQDVERRVDTRDSDETDLRLELETERNRAETLSLVLDRDRAAWEAHRESLEDEIARLRSQLVEIARGPAASGPSAAIETIENENRRLRETCHSLVKRSAESADAANLRQQLGQALAQLEETRISLREALDDRAREQIENQAALAAARTQMALAALQQAEAQAPAPEPPPAAAPTAPPSPDERIRALRQHLLEIHDREESERMRKSLAGRLSRIWRSSRPLR